MPAHIEQLVTSGTFSLDGGTWDVENNVWIIGDDTECLVIDAPHDASAIVEQIAGRKVVAIALTHAHDDHIKAAVELSQAVGASVHLHPQDRELWDRVYPEQAPDVDLSDGYVLDVAGSRLETIYTPGHTPGSVCFLFKDERTVFSGDTLFKGGPGATGRSYSDFPTIIESIQNRLLTLDPSTVVRTGHGDSTTIGDEIPDLQTWIQRGH
jgi:glyoxylase-like metal-dependent hydrolase (beta-lactamase superfamily II)